MQAVEYAKIIEFGDIPNFNRQVEKYSNVCFRYYIKVYNCTIYCIFVV